MATQSLDSNTALCSCQTTLYSVNPLLAVGAVLALAMSLYTFAMVSSMEERVLTVMEGRILTNSKDRTGMQNFANVFTGADVIEALTSSTHTSLDPRSGAVAWKPETVISPGLEAGRCWSFSGTSGHIGISLADEIIVTNLTVEHIALDLAPNLNTAPKDMTLWGLLDDASEVRKFRSRLRGHSLDKAVLPVSEHSLPRLASFLSSRSLIMSTRRISFRRSRSPLTFFNSRCQFVVFS